MPQEYSNAQIKWIHHSQQPVYYEEISNLTAKSTSRLTLVRQLCLFLDNYNIICCASRIHNAPVSELTRYPYLLPRNHPFTMLVIISIHFMLEQIALSLPPFVNGTTPACFSTFLLIYYHLKIFNFLIY